MYEHAGIIGRIALMLCLDLELILLVHCIEML